MGDLNTYADAAMVGCPKCRAAVGNPCVTLACKNGRRNCDYAICAYWRELSEPHLQRVVAARKAAEAEGDEGAVGLLARMEALAYEWERTADECERLSQVRAGLSDERDLRTAGLVNRRRATDLRAALAADTPTPALEGNGEAS